MLALVIAALTSHAQPMMPLDLHYERVNLANGRVLKDVAITSINRESGLVYVLEDRELKPYPQGAFPRLRDSTYRQPPLRVSRAGLFT